MLNKLKKAQSEKSGRGFTIIEVMIVLAIAGLILLIVFLAVPALQRSARNTQRKNDAAGVLAAVSNYVSDNGGTPPSNISWSQPTLTVCNTAGCTGTADAKEQAKLGYYTGITATSGGTPATSQVTIDGSYTALPGTPLDALIIEEGATCASPTSISSAGTRSVVAVYGIESGGAYQWQCTGS